MRRLIFPFVSVLAVFMLSAGACGNSENSSAPLTADATTDAASDNYVPYTPITTKCVPAPYANPVTVPDASFDLSEAGEETDASDNADASDDADAGPLFELPQLVSRGGPVLRQPRIIPITYPGDILADQIEDFVGSIGCTDYWRQTVSEYGVGQAQMLAPVRLTTAAPTNLTDTDIQTFIGNQIAAGAPGFANPPDDAIFTLFVPASTTVELQGTTSCTGINGFEGYHNAFVLAGKSITYALITRCTGNIIDDVTDVVAHELVEASTDPFPNANPGYRLVDLDHIGFALLAGGEAGDLCIRNRDARLTPDAYPFNVQRTWSNASLLAGHDPCVPAEPGPYAVAIPAQPDSIAIYNTEYGTGVITRGVAIPVGRSRTIDVRVHSDDLTTKSWTIAVIDETPFYDSSSHLTLTLDTTTANVDGVAHLTITRNVKSSVYGAELFALQSTALVPMTTATYNVSTWYGLVGDP